MTSKCCRNCQWYKKDYGVWCMNGWSGMDRDNGHCLHQPVKVEKLGSDVCSNHEPIYTTQYVKGATEADG